MHNALTEGELFFVLVHNIRNRLVLDQKAVTKAFTDTTLEWTNTWQMELSEPFSWCCDAVYSFITVVYYVVGCSINRLSGSEMTRE